MIIRLELAIYLTRYIRDPQHAIPVPRLPPLAPITHMTLLTAAPVWAVATLQWQQQQHLQRMQANIGFGTATTNLTATAGNNPPSIAINAVVPENVSVSGTGGLSQINAVIVSDAAVPILDLAKLAVRPDSMGGTRIVGSTLSMSSNASSFRASSAVASSRVDRSRAAAFITRPLTTFSGLRCAPARIQTNSVLTSGSVSVSPGVGPGGTPLLMNIPAKDAMFGYESFNVGALVGQVP